MKQLPIAFFLVCAMNLFLLSCQEEDILVPDNTAPPDYTIEETTIINYINRVYISALGREPDSAEALAANILINTSQFDKTDRAIFVDDVLAKDEFLANLYNIARIEFLDNADTSDIRGELNQVLNRINQDSAGWDAATLSVWQAQREELLDLLRVYDDLFNDVILIDGMYQRISNNNIYDDINMGTENFVVSTFQNFVRRYPTQSELAAGKLMVNGFQASLFLEVGKSKEDYFNIFFNSDDYYSGQVKYLFLRYLFREPLSAETEYFSKAYKENDSYSNMIREIMILDEFAGI